MDKIRKLGRDSIAIRVDVSKSQDVENMVNTVKEKFGKIDILINNAGISQVKSLLGMLEEDWDMMMDIHVKGTFLCTQMVGREMVKEKKGSIINVSSMSGFIINRPQKQTHYNTAKAAIAHFTKSATMELANYNIRVNAIAPGYIKTDMTAPALDSDMAREWLSLSPMARFGEPHEIKGLALCLASKASSFVTGSVILMDGGYSCW